MEKGANPNICAKREFSPVLEDLGTIDESNCKILEIMLEYGLDLNKIEGGLPIKEQIKMCEDEGLNEIIEKYNK